MLNRKELSIATSQFAKAAAVLSNREEHTGLSRAMAQLADVEEKVKMAHSLFGFKSLFIFLSVLHDDCGLVTSYAGVPPDKVLPLCFIFIYDMTYVYRLKVYTTIKRIPTSQSYAS